MSNELIPYQDIEKMAAVTAKSGLFGIKTPEQAAALMLIAQAEGLHPAIAARDYHIINGRPSLKADAMLARFQAAGGKVEFQEYSDKRVAAIFSHPQGGSLKIDWTIERAKQAGLGGKDIWRQYPRQMLRARVISEGIRTIFPGCIGSFYTPEEVQDFDIKPAKDITPGPVIETSAVEILPDIDSLSDTLSQAKTLEELRQLWRGLQLKGLDPEGQKKLKAVKDKLKKELEAAAGVDEL